MPLLKQWSGDSGGASRARLLDEILSTLRSRPLHCFQPGSGAAFGPWHRDLTKTFREGCVQAASVFSARWKTICFRYHEWTAEFEIVGIKKIAGSASALDIDIDIRYDLVGTRKDSGRRVGHWLTRWSRSEAQGWRVLRWQAIEETLTPPRGAGLH